MNEEIAKQNEAAQAHAGQDENHLSLFDILAVCAMLGLLASTNWEECGYDPDELATHSFTYATAVFDKLMERRGNA